MWLVSAWPGGEVQVLAGLGAAVGNPGMTFHAMHLYMCSYIPASPMANYMHAASICLTA